MSQRKTRIEAARLAAQLCSGQDTRVSHLWSLMVLFENYIDLGAEKTNEMMKIIKETPVMKLREVK